MPHTPIKVQKRGMVKKKDSEERVLIEVYKNGSQRRPVLSGTASSWHPWLGGWADASDGTVSLGTNWNYIITNDTISEL